jgi:hypothetical protein
MDLAHCSKKLLAKNKDNRFVLHKKHTNYQQCQNSTKQIQKHTKSANISK